ncbi:IGSF8 protein, partial [Polypterus senegalus]|nr:IGSF8 protein [Polypterus senegalus]
MNEQQEVMMWKPQSLKVNSCAKPVLELTIETQVVVTCREVSLPPGPLYRVAGFPLSLPCSVSGYDGSPIQDFEWFLYRNGAGGNPIGAISTRDRNFPYAPFKSRVRAGEVRIERDRGDMVRLVIQRLRAEDQGVWECYTPSTDARYLGNYSSTVTVNVMPDTLQVSYVASSQMSSRSLAGQSLPEGAELELTCAASVQSEQHTHLSVTFSARGGVDAAAVDAGRGHNLREIISIAQDQSVVPGRSKLYAERYANRGIILDKRKAGGERDLYVLRIAQVVPQDGGAYFCNVAQWIRDPQGEWEKIAQRTLELGNITITPLADTLTVTVTPEGEVSLPIGSPLSLSCAISGISPSSRPYMLIQWLRGGPGGGAELSLAQMAPDGVVSWREDIVRKGEVSFEKEAEGRYTLRFFSSHPADAGLYQCAVSIYTGLPSVTQIPAANQRSNGVNIKLKMKAVTVRAVAGLSEGPTLRRGHTISLLCNVSVETVGLTQIEMRWLAFHNREDLSSETVLVELRHDGTTSFHSNRSDISLDQPTLGTYRLRIHNARMEEQGLYQCQVTVWGQDQHGAWYNTGASSHSSLVQVYMYSQALDLLFIPILVGVSSALFVGVTVVAAVTCCFMSRLARKSARK